MLERCVAGGEVRGRQEKHRYLRTQSRQGVIHEMDGLAIGLIPFVVSLLDPLGVDPARLFSLQGFWGYSYRAMQKKTF